MKLVNITMGKRKTREEAKVSPYFLSSDPLPELQFDIDGELVLPSWERKPNGYVLIELQKGKAVNHLMIKNNDLIRCSSIREIYSTELEATEVLKRFMI